MGGARRADAGRRASTPPAWDGRAEPLPEGNWPIIAASPIPYFPYSQVPREMDRRDMDAGRGDFVRAAQMGEEAGFDGLEMHFAHGYLFASFISPPANRRIDQYRRSPAHPIRI